MSEAPISEGNNQKDKDEPQEESRQIPDDKSQLEADGVDGLKIEKKTTSRSSEALLTLSNENENVQPIFTKKSERYLHRFKYYFSHPYLRLLIAYGVTLCNFFIYAEDPVAHSFAECTIPVIGNDYAFVAARYPPNGFSALKVLLYIIAVIIGLIVGKLIHRLLLRRAMKLSMFQNDQGSWMIMFFCSLVLLLIFSFIYNGFLGLSGTKNAKYKVSSYMGITNYNFMKAAALGTWMGDFVTAWMVTDMMLQDKSKYPLWAKTAREWWNKGWHRIVLFWAVLLTLTAIVASAIISDYIKWDSFNRDFIHTSELGRGFLASFILVMDIVIVMQDWDFPMFNADMDVKLPGINTAHIQFNIPDCLRKEHWKVHIAGKWFNYGILFMVMLLDLNMWKNQIFYKPYDYGQYSGPNGKIYSVKNTTFLAIKNTTTLTYDWRFSHPNVNSSYGMTDIVVNSRFRNKPLAAKATAFIPCVAAFVVLAILVWMFGRKDDVESVEALGMSRISTFKKVSGVSIKKFKDGVDGDLESNEIEGNRLSYGSTSNKQVIVVEAESGEVVSKDNGAEIV